MTSQEMEQVLAKIKELTELCYKNEQHVWRGTKKMGLLPPAKAADIKALQKKLPFPLPPSYVQFLKLHNGCQNFWAQYQLAGISGKPRQILEKQLKENLLYQIKEALQNWVDKYKTKKPAPQFKSADKLTNWLLQDEKKIKLPKNFKLTKEQILLYESWFPNPNCHHLFLPNHMVFGTDEAGTFLLFNEGKKGKDGEYEVIYYSYDIGIKKRYANFPAFFSQTLKDLEDRIAKKHY